MSVSACLKCGVSIGEPGVGRRLRYCEQHKDTPNASDRVLDMCARYRKGETLQQIGDAYGITRERVRQLIKPHGLRAKNGGKRMRAEVRKLSREAKKDSQYLASHGCTFSQYKMLRLMGRSTSRDRSPLGAFGRQRQNAGYRGIGWELTVWQWWTIWQESGKWSQRGRGQGYVMARKNDEGPYAVGNVFITSAIDNCSDAPKKKKSDLPCGVSLKLGKFTAHRMLGGKTYYLGTHETPEAAHQAYLNGPHVIAQRVAA